MEAATKPYEEAARATWAPLLSEKLQQPHAQLRELVRYATLAANSHNSQPWRFIATQRAAGGSIIIAPDFARRCPAVDPDDRHLFASLGCAAENLVHAAAAMGLKATPVMAGDSITVALETGVAERSSLFEAIPHRQSTRAKYDGKLASPDVLRALETAAREPGISLLLITDRAKIATVIDYVVQGNTAQMRDQAFMDELKSWMRFNDADAVATMDGLFSRASSHPALPGWIARPMLRFALTEASENKQYREHIESSAGVAVFVSDTDDKVHWVAAGRAQQRFCLQATALDFTCAHINQPVEVSTLRAQFASFLGVPGKRPDIVLRFGKGPELPRSLRRPPELVMREAA